MMTIQEDVEELVEMTVNHMDPSIVNALAAIFKIGKKKELPDWYGIKGIKFIWNGEWADPEIEYKGKKCSAYVVEDTMWEFYYKDGCPGDFNDYMRENEEEVRDLCEMALFSCP